MLLSLLMLSFLPPNGCCPVPIDINSNLDTHYTSALLWDVPALSFSPLFHSQLSLLFMPRSWSLLFSPLEIEAHIWVCFLPIHPCLGPLIILDDWQSIKQSQHYLNLVSQPINIDFFQHLSLCCPIAILVHCVQICREILCLVSLQYDVSVVHISLPPAGRILCCCQGLCSNSPYIDCTQWERHVVPLLPHWFGGMCKVCTV